MKKICFIIMCSILICGCESKVEETPFNLSCADNTRLDDSIIIEKYTNTLVIPKGTKFLEDDTLFKDGYYCYDKDTKESIPNENITIDISNVNVNEVGAYKIKVNAKYNNMIGNTEVDVKVAESCSGNCTIKTSNWVFEVTDDIKYQEISSTYRILNVPIKLTPTDNAFYSNNEKTTHYSDLLHGFVELRVDNKTFVRKYVADDEDDRTIGEKDNALAQTYIRNQPKNTVTYLKFRVVPIIESEAYIDFYDLPKDEHHFYYIHN